MAQASRQSLDSEPDLVAYDSSSILPAAGAGYSYGPPPSVSPTDNMSRQSIDRMASSSSGHNVDTVQDKAATSPGYSNRSRARAMSIASKFSHATLPLYSTRDETAGPSAASPQSKQQANGKQRKSEESFDHDYHSGDDDDYEDDSDEDLEMDTLNKNSGGKGGWKMVANTDTPLSALFSSSSHTHPPGRRSMSDAQEHREKPHGAHNLSMGKASRFERFDKLEWSAMAVSLVLVAFLTIASLHICFSGA